MTGIVAKSILNKSKRRDPWFLDDYTINPYSACSYNCVYCYIRGSKYGEHMERKLAVKTNAVELLDKVLRLRSRKDQYGIIVLASATDPYLQSEEQEQMTRRLLEVILQYKFPLHVITKSTLVKRDFDLLKKINDVAILPRDLQGKVPAKVFITFSFSTLDDAQGKIFEPGAAAPSARLQTMREALGAGFISGVSLMPLLPYLTDTSEALENFYQTFADAGARYIFPASITLFGDGPATSKTLTLRAIQLHYPELAANYNKLFADGYQIDRQYHKDFVDRVSAVKRQFQIPDRINHVPLRGATPHV